MHADTDECVQSGTPCHADADCMDTVGGFDCFCKPGYRGDGKISCEGKKLYE